MPTFYHAALDQLVPDLARTLRTTPTLPSLNRPAITVVQAQPGPDRDMLIRDVIDAAVVRAHLPLPMDAWVLTGEASPTGAQRAVRAMLTQDPSQAMLPRVLVMPGLMDLPLTLRQPVLIALRALDDAPAPCHVITTQDPSTDVPLEWAGRILRVSVDLTPRQDLTAVLLARGATLPGRSPLVRRLSRRQWNAASLLDRRADPLYAQALGAFTAEHLAREAWPWAWGEDDPVRRLALATLGLPPDAVRTVLTTLVQRLANHPLMRDQVDGAEAWGEPVLAHVVREALLLALMRPVCGWDPARQTLAIEVLSTRAAHDAHVLDAEWTVVDDHVRGLADDAVLDVDAIELAPPPETWWSRLLRWCLGQPAPLKPNLAGMSRGDALVWAALTRLDDAQAAQRWVSVSVGVARTCVRWPEDEARATLVALVEGLAGVPGLWPHDPAQWTVRWPMGARHALLTALEALPGWSEAHQRLMLDALGLDPFAVRLYSADGSTPAPAPVPRALPG